MDEDDRTARPAVQRINELVFSVNAAFAITWIGALTTSPSGFFFRILATIKTVIPPNEPYSDNFLAWRRSSWVLAALVASGIYLLLLFLSRRPRVRLLSVAGGAFALFAVPLVGLVASGSNGEWRYERDWLAVLALEGAGILIWADCACAAHVKPYHSAVY